MERRYHPESGFQILEAVVFVDIAILQEALGGEKRQRVEEVVVSRSSDTRFISFAIVIVTIFSYSTSPSLVISQALSHHDKFHHPSYKETLKKKIWLKLGFSSQPEGRGFDRIPCFC